jgi:hypothetical protein
MSTKTEIIYTYKSPVEIPPSTIHALQDGPAGRLSIGIVDTQDYDYTYVSGISGSYIQQFLPIKDGEDDLTNIISGVSGGTYRMMLQDEGSVVQIDNVTLNATVTKFQQLNVLNAQLEYIYDYVPPLIINAATLNCETRTDLFIINAQLNLKLKKKILNLPVILGAEFCTYGTRDWGFWDGPPGAGVWKKGYRGWRTNILVIHDEAGANLPAFSHSGVKNPFNNYQTFTGVRRHIDSNLGSNYSSIVKVKHPFGDPLSIEDFTTETGIRKRNVNNEILLNQSLDFKWFLYNGLVDMRIDYDKRTGQGDYDTRARKAGWKEPNDGDGFWKGFQINNDFNAMVSGGVKLFDHQCLYNSYFQNYVNTSQLPNPDGLNVNGQYLQTNVDSGNRNQSSFITNILYTTFGRYYDKSYLLSSKLESGNQAKYGSDGPETSYNDVLNLANISFKPVNKFVAVDDKFFLEQQRVQQAKNYFYDYLNLNKNGEFQSRSSRFGGIRNLALPGGTIDLSILNEDETSSQFTSIDTTRTFYNFDIKNQLRSYKNLNNQTLQITDLGFEQTGYLAGVHGNVHRVDGITDTVIIDLNAVSTGSNGLTGPQGSNETLGSIINRINNTAPKNLPIEISTESTYELRYNFSGKPVKYESLYYDPDELIIGSVQNDGEALINPNAKIDVKPVIRNSIFNAGTTGRVFDITNWGLTGSSIKLNNTLTRTIPGLGGKYLAPSGSLDISGYYEFAGNTGGGFTGREPIDFSLDYEGSTFMYSREAQIINVQGITFAIDFTSGLTALIDPYTQEIHTPAFNLIGGMTGGTGYITHGIPVLGITATAFNPNAIVLWETAEIKVQYNTDLDPNGQLVRQAFASEDLTYVEPIDIVNTNPIYEDKEFVVPTDLSFPLNKRDIKLVKYSDGGYYTTTGTINTYDLVPTRDSYRGPTASHWVRFDGNPNNPASYIDSRSLTIPGNYFGKLIVYRDVTFSSSQVDYYCVVYTRETITPATLLPNFSFVDFDLTENNLPAQPYYLGLKRYLTSAPPLTERIFSNIGVTGTGEYVLDGVTLSATSDFDDIVLPIGDSDSGGSSVRPGRIMKYNPTSLYSNAIIPSIPKLKLGTAKYTQLSPPSTLYITNPPNVLGKDFIDLKTAQLYMDYSYGENLFSEPFNQVINLGETFGQINPPQTTLVSKYLFRKEERITKLPYVRFYLHPTLYLVNIRKNPTGYTFNQTPFNWDIYDPTTYKNYKIINYPFAGIVLNSDIDNLIDLNDYTLDRTPGTNKFYGITDIETDPPIDLSSRNMLDNISLLYTDVVSNKLTNIILNPGSTASVPYLHKFFKFNYLNTDKELFLLVSSSITGSSGIEASIEGLYVSLIDQDPNPFITSQNDNTYGLTNQLVTFDLSKGLTLGQYFDYNNVYLDPILGYGTGVTSYSIDVKYSSSAYQNQQSLEYFGFTGGSTASILVKGLMPGITYRNNWLSYKLTDINQYISSSTGTTFRGSWGTGNTGQYLPSDVVFNNVPNQIGNTFNKPDNNYYVNNSVFTTKSPPVFSDGRPNSIWKQIPLEPKSKILNFDFYSGNTGLIFSCNSNLSQTQNKVFSYNLRIRDASYTSFSSSVGGIVRTLGTSSDPNYGLCVDFNDPSVTITKDGIDTPSKVNFDTLYDIGKDYFDLTIKGLQRGKSYLASIYLYSKTASSFISNKIFTTSLLIPKRSDLALRGPTLSSPYSYQNTLLKADLYSANTEQETSLMNGSNGYLYTIDESGKVYSKQLLLADSNNFYGKFNPVTRDIPIKIRNLNPGTTFSNLSLRYSGVDRYEPLSLGVTASSNGLITPVVGEGATATQYILYSIPTFTSSTGSTSGPGITGIINIQSPSFYNSFLTITNFNFYNNDVTNSYPEIYGGTAIVKLNSNVVGTRTLNPLLTYPATIGITLNKDKLDLGQLNNLTVSYEWTDFNNMSYSSTVYEGGSYVLNYSVNIARDQTTINIPFTSLFSKSIPRVNTLTTKVGDMNIRDLKCDLIVKAGLTGPNRTSPFFYKGEYDSGNTYFSNWTVSQGSTFYALMGVTMSKGISPSQDRAWVELTPYLPAGKSFNTGNVAIENRNNFVYLEDYTNPYSNFRPFLHDDPTNNIYNINFGDRYLKLAYNNGNYDGIFQNLIPNQTYALQYIRSQLTLDNGSNLTLQSGSTSIGQTTTLMNYVGGDSLTGSTSTQYTLSNLHYNGSTSYFTDGQVFLNGNVQINYEGDNFYYFAATGTSGSINSKDWIVCLAQGVSAISTSTILPVAVGVTYKKGDLVSLPAASNGVFAFTRDFTTVGASGSYSGIVDPGFAWAELSVNGQTTNNIFNQTPRYLDVPSTTYPRGAVVYNTTYSTGKDVVRQGITFTSTENQDYLTYQPEISINQEIFDQSTNSYIFYNGLTARAQKSSENYNKVGFDISEFGLTGYNLDDYFVIKGATTNKTTGLFGSSGYTSTTGTINYYKEYKLRDHYYPNDSSFRGLIISNLAENTTYSGFNLSYRYAYTNRLSNSIDLSTFTTSNGLEVVAGLSAGVRLITANIRAVSIEGIPQINLFRTNNPQNRFYFKMFKYRPDGRNTAADQTDFNDIRGTNNLAIPATNIFLYGADQGVLYDRLYFLYTLIDTDGSINTFERTYTI